MFQPGRYSAARSHAACPCVLLGAAFALLVLAIWVALEFHAQAAHALGPEAASMKAVTTPVGIEVEGAPAPLSRTVAPLAAPVQPTAARAIAPVKQAVRVVVSVVPDAAFASADDAIRATSRSRPAIASERASRSTSAEAARAPAAPTSTRPLEPRNVLMHAGRPFSRGSSGLLAFPLSTSHGERWSPTAEHGSGSALVLPVCDLPVPSAGRRFGRSGAGRPVLQFASFEERPG